MKQAPLWFTPLLLLALASAAPAQQASPEVLIDASPGGSVTIPDANILRTCAIDVSMGGGSVGLYDVYWVFNPSTIQFIPYAVGPASDECETRQLPTPPVFDQCDLNGDLHVDGHEASSCYQQGQPNGGPDECDMNGDGSVSAEEESNCMGPPDAEQCDLDGDNLVSLEEENQCMGGPDGDHPDGGPYYDPACHTDQDGALNQQEASQCPGGGPDLGDDPDMGNDSDDCGPNGCGPAPSDDPVACDMNGNNTIDPEEAAQCEVPPAQCDANGDGSVTVSEAESCQPPHPCDTDGDGDVSESEAAACPADGDEDEGAEEPVPSPSPTPTPSPTPSPEPTPTP